MLAIPQIRLALPNDAFSIAELSRDYIEHGLGWSWTKARVLRMIRDVSTNVAVIEGRGCVLGFGIMKYGDETAHLILLGVQPTQRKRGLGALLVSWLEESARTAGIERMQVEARADNPKAIAFYRRLGFIELEHIVSCYGGVIDGVRLEKNLKTHNRFIE